MTGRAKVGIRELRQNLSVHLRKVKQGESLEVTERGQPVALLTPLPERMSARERLIAEGRMIPGKGNLADLGSPPRLELKMSLSDALEEQREERDLLGEREDDS
jgi:prevent-host-death family protein